MLDFMSLWRSFSRIALLGLLPLAQTAPALAAPDKNGWFEARPEPVSAESTNEAPPAPEPVPSGADLPSLPPSPLLERDTAPAHEPGEISGERDPRALSDFRPTLEPYGTWVNHPTYGTVWVPYREVVGPSFAPYVSSGRWALDDDGEWVWVSDYPFGGVVFHYGRWVWITGSGWAWVPGYRYAPAWVTWRVPTGSYAYVGWAPMGPDYVWHNGIAVSFWYGVPTSWVFCPSVHVFHRHVHHYVVRDRVVINRVAANTRRYRAAAPRAYASAAPRATAERRSLAGPSLASARVPAHAVPAERVRTRAEYDAPARYERSRPERGFDSPRREPERRVDAPRRIDASRRTESVPRMAEPRMAPRLRSERAQADRRAAPQPRPEPARQAEPRRIEPRQAEPRRIEPRRIEPRQAEPRQAEPRRIEPRQAEPRRAEPIRRAEPMRRPDSSPRFEPRHAEPMRRAEPMRAPRGGEMRRSLPRSRH